MENNECIVILVYNIGFSKNLKKVLYNMFVIWKWIKILSTKKRLMKSKKSQYEFNEIFSPYTKREVKKDLKRLGIK